MLTDKALEELRAERRADYLAEAAREEGSAAREAIAEADAHTSNAGLPTYSELVAALRGWSELRAEVDPDGLFEGLELSRARALLARIPA